MHEYMCKCAVNFYNVLKSIQYNYIIITFKKKTFFKRK